MADPQDNFATSKVETDAHVQADQATGQSPMGSINHDFEEREVAARAQKMGMNYVDIGKVHINPDFLKLLPEADAKMARVIPFFKVGKKLRLAIVHPTHSEAQAIIQRLKAQGYLINVNLASDTGMQRALAAYKDLPAPQPINTENIINEEQVESFQKEIENLASLKEKIQSVTAEEALNFINVGALKTGASDIHYQPEENHVTLRFRIDGVLQDILDLSRETYNYIANQLKYKAGMKLNIDNVPQDGRYFFTVNKRKIDVRVSSIPTEYSESFVCRLLDSEHRSVNIEELGFEGRNLKLLQKALTLANGMILITGPTGSGKTTTLYSLLNQFNQPENKIITLEDPIEYHLEGVTQSQINEKRGYSFASGLRAILRQDPDIVMIGEIRDEDTAQAAAQAALTGHVLLSTLHTNSAIETVARLQNIGLKQFMIAPALSIVVAQRLVRKICPYCAVQKPLTSIEQNAISSAAQSIKSVYPETVIQMPPTLPHAEGCDKCSHTGYLGQIAIAEIFENTDELKEKILSGASSAELHAIIRQHGMLSLAEDGILKVLGGLTTLSEVDRVSDLPVANEVTSVAAPTDDATQL